MDEKPFQGLRLFFPLQLVALQMSPRGRKGIQAVWALLPRVLLKPLRSSLSIMLGLAIVEALVG